MSTSVIKTETKVRKRAGPPTGHVTIQQTPVGSLRTSLGGSGMSMTMRRSNVRQSGIGMGMIGAPGEATKLTSDAVNTVKGMRGVEKKEMNNLNGRLAEILEKNKTLKATNQALWQQLEEMKKLKALTGDRVREEYEEELTDARDALKEALAQLAPLQSAKLSLEDKVDTLEAQMEDLQKINRDLQIDIDRLNQMMSDYESEINALKKGIESANKERDRYKREVENLKLDNNRLRSDLEAARTAQINAQNERDSLAEELEFLRTCDDKEITELRDHIKCLEDMQPKMESMYQTGIKEAMAEMSNYYQDKYAELQDEYDRRLEDRILSIQQNQRRDNPDASITKSENKQLKIESRDLKDRLHDFEREVMSMQATIRRDDTDGISKKENKNLRSEVSASKRSMQGLEAENKRLRDELNQLRLQMDEIDRDHEDELMSLREKIAMLEGELSSVETAMETMKDARLSLELEIACYKKLLDGEEAQLRRTLEDSAHVQSRGASDLASIITSGGGGSSSGGSSSQQASNPARSPAASSNAGKQPDKAKKPGMSQSVGRIKVTKSAKGDLQVIEMDQGGRFIVLHNKSSKDVPMTNYTLTRSGPRGKQSSYKFPNYVLKRGSKLKVLSAQNEEDAEDEKNKGEFEVLVATGSTCRTWLHGSGEARLVDPEGQQKAELKLMYE